MASPTPSRAMIPATTGCCLRSGEVGWRRGTAPLLRGGPRRPEIDGRSTLPSTGGGRVGFATYAGGAPSSHDDQGGRGRPSGSTVEGLLRRRDGDRAAGRARPPECGRRAGASPTRSWSGSRSAAHRLAELMTRARRRAGPVVVATHATDGEVGGRAGPAHVAGAGPVSEPVSRCRSSPSAGCSTSWCAPTRSPARPPPPSWPGWARRAASAGVRLARRAKVGEDELGGLSGIVYRQSTGDLAALADRLAANCGRLAAGLGDYARDVAEVHRLMGEAVARPRPDTCRSPTRRSGARSAHPTRRPRAHGRLGRLARGRRLVAPRPRPGGRRGAGVVAGPPGPGTRRPGRRTATTTVLPDREPCRERAGSR